MYVEYKIDDNKITDGGIRNFVKSDFSKLIFINLHKIGVLMTTAFKFVKRLNRTQICYLPNIFIKLFFKRL